MGLEISVVIPVYNASKTIVSTINSVLNQTYKVSEIILINDGSIDDSSNIIKSTFKKYLEEKFIILIDKKNEGPSKARNVGVEIAKKEWIAFLDSDDQWTSNKTEEQVKLIDKNWKESRLKNINNTTNFLNEYHWSSYLDYLNTKRPENKIIAYEDFPDYFTNKNVFKKEIFEWLNFKNLSLNPKVTP